MRKAIANWWKRLRGYESVAALESADGDKIIRWLAFKETKMLERETVSGDGWICEQICRSDPTFQEMWLRVMRKGRHGWLKRNVTI